MAREETCILTNMCMICDGSRILVQDRKNPDWPGITFPGGHVEPKESFVASCIREVKEERSGYFQCAAVRHQAVDAEKR